MRDPFDVWFVRWPDGRVVRAKSTASVRHHVESGHIPMDSWVRRRGEDDWSSLEWTVEFADLVTAKRKQQASADGMSQPRTEPDFVEKDKASGRNHHELRTVGVRGLVEELLAALDSTLNRRKLGIAGLTCMAGTAVLVAARLLELSHGESPWVDWPPVGLGLVFIFGIGTALLTRITFVELSKLRQARWGEVFGRLERLCPRIMGCFVLVGGTVVLAIAGLRNLPGWVLTHEAAGDPAAAGALTAVATVVSLLLQVLLWPIFGLSLLLPPAVIVEEVPIPRAIFQWWNLVRLNLGRVILYEGLAFALGSVMTFPFLVPVLLVGPLDLEIATSGVGAATLAVLYGCALTPLLAYLVVANVFIYLNLRYEFSASLRE